MQTAGIQIIGTQRSGSNLLRLILNQSGEIASPHPPHILATFIPLLYLYGRLTIEVYKRLIDDVVDYVEANPVSWQGLKIDRNLIFSNSLVCSIFEINRLIYEQCALNKKAKYWCCKSMSNVYFAGDLEKYNHELKYIYLYRDGRDVAVSFKKAIVGEKHIYHLAKQWKQDQEACLALSKEIPPERFYFINYETLITDPQTAIKQICGFLNITFHQSMLNFHHSCESKLTAAAGEMWQNLQRPIIKNNAGKFHKELTSNDIEIFELINHRVLTQLNYSITTSLDNPQLINKESISKYEKENSLLIKSALLNAKKADLDNRASQLAIIQSIKINRMPAQVLINAQS